MRKSFPTERYSEESCCVRSYSCSKEEISRSTVLCNGRESLIFFLTALLQLCPSQKVIWEMN